MYQAFRIVQHGGIAPMMLDEALGPDCPFCRLEPAQVVLSNDHALAFPDRYPIAPGHSLVIPLRHVMSVFDLSAEELASVWRMVFELRAHLRTKHHPSGFTVGVNDGTAAGQTIGHAHVHVVPRYDGDVLDPRGGIRWVIPEKARYWDEVR